MDGLLANNISDLASDPLGNLWIASWKGLNMYDGNTFSSYTIADSLVSKGIWQLAADEDGLIWIGTGDGISVMQPLTETVATPGITTTIASTNQQVSITIPQNAIPTQTYFTYTQQLGPTQDIGNFQFAGASFSLDAKDINGGAVTTFNAPLSMIVSFSEITLPDVTKIKLFYWDVVNKSWQDAASTCTPASDYVYDVNSKQLKVNVCHLTEFALLFQPNQSIYLPLVLR